MSTPTYDPNLFVDGITPENWKELNEHPDKPMINRTINGAYPPGSTFKPFMALAALEMGNARRNQAIADPGFFTFGGTTFRDDKKGGHGWSTCTSPSSIPATRTTTSWPTTWASTTSPRSWAASVSASAPESTLGGTTGESKGAAVAGMEKQRFKRPEQQKWYAGETISIGIGQGYNAYTPIQLAQATATLANNGVMFRPHLVQNIVDTRNRRKAPGRAPALRDLGWKQRTWT